MKDKTTALQIVAGIISLIKGLIPAALVAWNNYLRNQASRLKSKIIVMSGDKKIKEEQDAIDKDYKKDEGDSRGIISRYLMRRKLRNSDSTDKS